MFFARLRGDDGSLNNMEVVKLKNKLGTRQLPTAEMLLDGVDATLVSEPGRGVSSITHMLTITRLSSGVGAISPARR
jgi:alkylation response protein AidB-like acyl-CoA dehydrogenase